MYIAKEFICGQRGYKSNNKIENLAFLTYTKIDGEICSKKSYDSWLGREYVDNPKRNRIIKETTYENTPLEGFKVLHTVGGSGGGGNTRQAYVRILDPRGFEIEITDENFLSICKSFGVTKGVLDGKYAYGFGDRGRIQLLNEESYLYKNGLAETEQLIEDANKAKDVPKFSMRNIKLGYTYTIKYYGGSGKTAIYIGKTPVCNWKDEYKNEHIFIVIKENAYGKNDFEVLRATNIVLEKGPSSITPEECKQITQSLGKTGSYITWDIYSNRSKRSEENDKFIKSYLNKTF